MPYDEELIRLVPHYKNDWKKICKRIQNYFKVRVTPNFLRNRYRNLTVNDPKCPRLVFNTQMDLIIAQLVNKHGLNWNLIAKEMGILDPVKIKNRYYSQLKRKGLLSEIINKTNAMEVIKVQEGQVEIPLAKIESKKKDEKIISSDPYDLDSFWNFPFKNENEYSNNNLKVIDYSFFEDDQAGKFSFDDDNDDL